MTDFSIRTATVDDAEQMVAHMLRIVVEPDNGTTRSSADEVMSVEAERQFLTDIATVDNSVLALAVTADGSVIGVASFMGGKRRAMRHQGSIGIAVHKDWRNQGVGTALMQYLINWARGTGIITRLELEVNTHNERAVHVYQKVGFEIEGRKKKALFKEGRYIDNFVMALLLE
jgi:RimJ/RimL family protein N-acetyltransferase